MVIQLCNSANTNVSLCFYYHSYDVTITMKTYIAQFHKINHNDFTRISTQVKINK